MIPIRSRCAAGGVLQNAGCSVVCLAAIFLGAGCGSVEVTPAGDGAGFVIEFYPPVDPDYGVPGPVDPDFGVPGPIDPGFGVPPPCDYYCDDGWGYWEYWEYDDDYWDDYEDYWDDYEDDLEDYYDDLEDDYEDYLDDVEDYYDD